MPVDSGEDWRQRALIAERKAEQAKELALTSVANAFKDGAGPDVLIDALDKMPVAA